MKLKHIGKGHWNYKSDRDDELRAFKIISVIFFVPIIITYLYIAFR